VAGLWKIASKLRTPRMASLKLSDVAGARLASIGSLHADLPVSTPKYGVYVAVQQNIMPLGRNREAEKSPLHLH
jgi:hypothetical protein